MWVGVALLGCDDPVESRIDSGEDLDATGDAAEIDADGDGLFAHEDCDDRDRTIGPFDSRPCTGECDSYIVECRDGVWGECPTSCECEPDEMRELACPMCGKRTQSCGSAGAWEDATPCMDMGVCEPEDTESVGACGRCPGGESIRSCTDECTWTEPTCDLSGASCNAWLLPPGGRAWQRIGLPADGPTNIQAAWFVEGVNRVWVLGDRVYELNPACLSGSGVPMGCWVADGTRTAYFSTHLETATVYFGHGIPTYAFDTAEQQLTAIAEGFDYQYFRDPSTGAMRVSVNAATAWTDPQAPSSREAVRAGFSRVLERDRWVRNACGSPASVPDGYLVYIGPEISFFTLPFPACGFFEEQPYDGFIPFTYPGRPELSQIGAAVYDDRFGLLILEPDL